MITFVTTNPGKFREVSAKLAPLGVRLRRLNRAYPEVQGDGLRDVVAFAAVLPSIGFRMLSIQP